ncbi:MAG TPA: hypothetical protein VGJ20_28835 [Xanthobacteraceae bacterium]|jgi:hypothetical protein
MAIEDVEEIDQLIRAASRDRADPIETFEAFVRGWKYLEDHWNDLKTEAIYREERLQKAKAAEANDKAERDGRMAKAKEDADRSIAADKQRAEAHSASVDAEIKKRADAQASLAMREDRDDAARKAILEQQINDLTKKRDAVLVEATAAEGRLTQAQAAYAELKKRIA